MSDTAFGFALVGIGILVVLGVVFFVFSRGGQAAPRPAPPPGVHLPNPSFLPVVMSLGGALIGLGLVFHNEGEVANLFLAVPGLVVFVTAAVWWVRAANREWHETESRTHGDEASH